MDVVWTDLAERDLGEIYDYLFARSPSATRGMVTGILGATARLADHPGMGPLALDVSPDGTVRCTVWRQYRIFYRVRAAQVLILRIWDARRDVADLVLERDTGEAPTR